MSLDAVQKSPIVLPQKARKPTAEEKKAEQAEVKKASRMMEALFLGMLWKEMRRTVNKTGLMSGGYGEDIFTDMLDQAVSEASVKGRSMGLADMLERQLSKDQSVKPKARQDYLKGSTGQGYQLPVDGVVSSEYGLRTHPVTGELKEHKGLDLAAPKGAPVMAARQGRVSFAGEQNGYGNLVIIDHPGGQTSYYGHLEEIKVKEGDKVASGQIVATVGDTGLSTGPHLHFEVRGSDGLAMDPMTVMASGSGRLT